MNHPRPFACFEPRSARRVALLLFATTIAALLPAASRADDNASSDVVELSPFTVNAADDHGYQANYTLSGTRLNTENRYVGAAITEITGQMLADLNINNFEDMLNYVPNSAPAQSGGLSSDPTGNESIFGVRYRVRGFLLTGFSQDFFLTRVAPDSYNLDRVSFSRGPNSILFGIGEPGGVTNAVTAKAGFKNAYEAGARFDSWGSKRYDASINQVLVPEKLAFKMAALRDEQQNDRKPWHNDADRVYEALTFKPFKTTTLEVVNESGWIERLNARAWAASDGVTPWLAAGSRAVPKNFLNITAPAAQPTLAQQQALGMQVFRTTPWNIMQLNGATSDLTYQGQFELRTAQYNVPGFTQASNGGISFRDGSIVPLSANVLGSGNKLKQHFKNTSVFLDQNLTHGFYLQLAFNTQVTNNLSDFSTGSNDNVYVDLLPTVRSLVPSNPNALTGTPVSNPNYGKYFTYTDTPTMFAEDYRDKTARATLSDDFNFHDHFDGAWAKYLGHHTLAGLVESNQSRFVNRGYQLRSAVRPPNQTRYDVGSSWIGIQHYIDPAKGNYDLPDLTGLYPRVWSENNADLPQATSTGIAPMWLGTSGTHTFTDTTSKMVAMQNFFWENKIVSTFGWREDRVDNWSAANSLDATTGLRGNVALVNPRSGTRTTTTGRTSSKGVVVTPVRRVGVFYNESSNFTPASPGTVDIFGRPLPNQTGEGKDYGLKLDFFDGKVTGSVDWFETDFKNQATRGPRVGPVGSFEAPRAASLAAIQDYYTSIGTPQAADIWNQMGYLSSAISYFDTQDYKAKGWEFSVTANPTQNWRILLNISKQNNRTANVAPTMTAWSKYIRTVLTNPVLLALPTTLLSADGTHYNTVADNLNLVDQRIVEIASLNGFADQRQPVYSANFVTGYDFTRGWLKNFGVGGSYRWRGRAIGGYGLLNSTSTALDGNSPYWNNATSWVGVFANYRFQLRGKMRVRLQLNVDNLLDEGKSNVMLSREVNGQRFDSRWALAPGQSFAFSANFEL